MPDVAEVRRRLVTLCLDLAAVERHRADDPANEGTLTQAVRSLESAIDTTAYVLIEASDEHPKEPGQ